MSESSLLKIEDLTFSFRTYGGVVKAVRGVSFEVNAGETVGIVGESGCGKSTLAKTIVGLNKEFDGKMEMDHLKPQMVFQDPFSSLNPARKIGWIMEEPLKLKGIKDKKKRK